MLHWPSPSGLPSDPFGITESLLSIQQAWLAAPEAYAESIQHFWENQSHLFASYFNQQTDAQQDNIVSLPEKDSRFVDPIWETALPFKVMKDQFLLMEKWVDHLIKQTPSLDHKTKQKARFWAKRYIEMFSPANFLFSNPAALSKAMATQGQSLVEGQRLFLADCQKQEISMVSPKFIVGQHVATTAGDVIFRNELIELIYYKPQQGQVYEKPILFVPPWINKFYILDLKPDKSMVQYLLQQGFAVFMISWKNPDKSMSQVSFDDYVLKGILAATQVVQDIFKRPIQAVGYCIGGTALMCLLAYLKQTLDKSAHFPIESATLLCSLVDFKHPGEIGIFIDEQSVSYLESMVAQQGLLFGEQMEMAFRLLRANGLIWHYVSSQYLMGEAPPVFDMLFWNSDRTHLPAKMYQQYIRGLYLENRLVKKNAFSIGKVGLDLGLIDLPLYILGTEIDHITPYESVFETAKHCVAAPIRMALAASGHIAGVLTPPSDLPKRHYRAFDYKKKQADFKKDLSTAEKTPGSWRTDWMAWLKPQSGQKKPAPSASTFKQYPSLGQAPGQYVLEKRSMREHGSQHPPRKKS